jgi:predicted naringenin-chalcone synthase
MTTAYINRIATAVPPHDVHAAFLRFAESMLADPRATGVVRRMAAKAGIDHRYSFLAPGADPAGAAVDADGFYRRGGFPGTGTRMRQFEDNAPALAADTVDRLQLGPERDAITHLLVTTCTGLSSPGIDLEMQERCRLHPSIERSVIGFMGCYAAINALKLARHIVRSDPAARVLVVNLELCTLHLQECADLEKILSFLLWGDGCAASLVTAEPMGLALDSFRALLVPDTRDLITWNIGDSGFDMVLSGQVPKTIKEALSDGAEEILDGAAASAVDLWAVHPGGRTVLDAVEQAFGLAPAALAASRAVLRRYGNMSSATVMFVLAALMQFARRGATGCAMSFGPGLVAETMLFRGVG